MIAFGISIRELRIFLERSLSEREKKLLLECYRLQGYTFSSLVRKLTNDSKYPESTVKLVLKRLKNFNLVDFGDVKNKGKPLIFTELGEIFTKVLRGESI